MKTNLMFAYGSNLNLRQMAYRCPNGKSIGRLRLEGWKLVFRSVADIVETGDPEDYCWGGVWRITEACERVLDRYEGVSETGRGLYRKEYIPIKPLPDGTDCMLVYVMNSTGVYPPSRSYFDCIWEGYKNFHIPKEGFTALKNAVQYSWDEKHPTFVERQRMRRHGRPALVAIAKKTTKKVDQDLPSQV